MCGPNSVLFTPKHLSVFRTGDPSTRESIVSDFARLGGTQGGARLLADEFKKHRAPVESKLRDDARFQIAAVGFLQPAPLVAVQAEAERTVAGAQGHRGVTDGIAIVARFRDVLPPRRRCRC